MVTAREALKDMRIEIENTHASFQGFGMVGKHAAQLYHQMGGVIACVACWDQTDLTSYTYRKKDGINFDELVSITDAYGGIDKAKAVALGYECLPGEAWIEQEVDILVPAALDNQIRLDNVDRIHSKVKIVAEAANGPTNPDADKILNQRELVIIPDILANAGGVICSYFEQVQGNMNYFWNKDEVLGKIDTILTNAYIDVSAFAQKNGLTLRDSSYMLAIDRVARACHERGWI
jgi:glutamate dehydrogenase (NAD(P)+)